MPEAEAEMTDMRLVHAAGPVDHGGDAILQDAQHLRLLSPRQPARRHRVVELLLSVREQRVDQTVDGLVVVLRNLRKALTAFELGAELRFRDADVSRRSAQAAEQPVVAEAMAKPAQKRKVTRRNALLERVTFSLGNSPRCNRCIDAVAEGLLQRVAQLARRDSQLLRCVVYDSLALLARRTGLGCGDCHAGSGCSQHGR